MASHTDNINVKSGRVLIQNLNYICDKRLKELNKSNLIAIIKRILDNTEGTVEVIEEGQELLPIFALNTPYFDIVDGEIKLIRNFLIWGDKMFKEDYVFRFDDNGNLLLDNDKNYELVNVVNSKIELTRFDWYNCSSEYEYVFNTLSKVLDINDLPILEGHEDTEDIMGDGENTQGVKAYTLYTPELADITNDEVLSKRRTFTTFTGKVVNDENTKEGYYKSAISSYESEYNFEEMHDMWLVEFTDLATPYSYISKEVEDLHYTSLPDKNAFISNFDKTATDGLNHARVLELYDNMYINFNN